MRTLRIFLSNFIIFLVVTTSISSNAISSYPSYIYSSPRPNAQFVQPETTITIRYPDEVNEDSLLPNLIQVEGSQSGWHTGSLQIARDGKTIIFTPTEPFEQGERVTVNIQSTIRNRMNTPLSGGSYQFTISHKAAQNQEQLSNMFPTGFLDEQSLTQLMADASENSLRPAHSPLNADYQTLPFDFPDIEILTPANETEEGYLFLSNFVIDWSFSDSVPYVPYLLIMDDAGDPVFYRRMPPGRPVVDFKVHDNGLLSYIPFSGSEMFVMDNTYEIVDTYSAGNGYTIDIHEFLMLPNGHVVFMIYDTQPVDMSQVVPGGNPDALVIGLVLQELDEDKNVVFQWRSWDHMEITDANNIDLTADGPIDYVHGNAIEIDDDGNWLVSSRSLDEITKINRTTGEIMWRLGGTQNEFTFIGADEPFFRQHDIRVLPNGNITLFDNRSGGPLDFSRAVEYELDEVNMTATQVWEYRDDGNSPAMGSTRRLENGNTLIGWGSKYPSVTEVKPDGSIALELQLAPTANPAAIHNSYRVFRSPWEGQPLTTPILVSTIDDGDVTTLHYSWNGATDIASYDIYAGAIPNALTQIGTAVKTSFETSTMLTPSQQAENCFFQVIPIDQGDNERTPSPIIMGEHCVVSRSFYPIISQDGDSE